MTALVRVRGVAVLVSRNKEAQHYARRFLTVATRSEQSLSFWSDFLREQIAQGKHTKAATCLLLALTLRSALLRKARAEAGLRAAMKAYAELQASRQLIAA